MFSRILRFLRDFCLTILCKLPDFPNCTNFQRFAQDQPGTGIEPKKFAEGRVICYLYNDGEICIYANPVRQKSIEFRAYKLPLERRSNTRCHHYTLPDRFKNGLKEKKELASLRPESGEKPAPSRPGDGDGTPRQRLGSFYQRVQGSDRLLPGDSKGATPCPPGGRAKARNLHEPP